jgi:hypothetical protein
MRATGHIFGFVLAGLVLIAWSFIGDALVQRFYVQYLYDRAVAKGTVPVTSLAKGWDRVCIARAYCGGRGDHAWEVCSHFLNDGLWGLVFYRGDELVAIERYPGLIRYQGADGLSSCLAIGDAPAFVTGGPKQLTLVPTK